jgi:soluble lytic murein transglycosylase-like protein
MSVAAVTARVAELQSLFAAPPAAAPAASAPAASAPAAAAAPTFAARLSAATAPAPAATVPYRDEITAAAQRHGIDPALLAGLIQQESGFDPAARSAAGAQGLTQLMPGTAAGLGVTDPLDPAQAIEGGAEYLADQLKAFGGDTARALAAYNAGPGTVRRYGGVPPYAETQDYVRRVQSYAAAFRAGTSIPSTV